MLGLLELLVNGAPKMPPRAEATVMAKGVALIKFLAEEERRKNEEMSARVASESSECRYSFADVSVSPPSDPHSQGRWRRSVSARGIKWSSAKYDLGGFHVEPKKRMPPDLHAATLSFSARLMTYVREKCAGSGQVAYTRSGVSKQIYSRIISYDDEVADKKTVMKFCIGLQLSMPEAELLMKSAGFAFSNTIPLDRAFTFAIENGIKNIHDVNELLTRNGLPDLGLKF